MEEENYQKELFEFEKPKRPFSKLANIFSKADFEGRLAITLGLEKVIFISIAVIMLMVVIYAAGVERGKGLSGKKAAAAVVKPVTAAEALGASHGTKTPQFLSTAQVVQSRTSTIAKKSTSLAEVSRDMSKPYTIIAVTFTRKDTALQEVSRLRREGLDASVIESGSYFQVVVGAYPDKDSLQSKKALSKVRQFYKDAYFKLK